MKNACDKAKAAAPELAIDGEIAELMYKTIQKLEAMSDAEFEELYIMPDGMVDD